MHNEKVAVQLPRATQLLDHGPTTLVTSAHDGHVNVMAASWAMPLDYDPPRVVVVVDKNSRTRELIDASGVFGLQLPTRALAPQTLGVGTHGGKAIDKFAQFGLHTFPGQAIAVPMVEGCVAWLECKVIPDDSRRHDLLIGEVIAAYSDSRYYSGNRWHFGDDPDVRTIHYVAGGMFFATGESFHVKPL